MPSIAATTSLTLSHGCGDITFATCGANDGEDSSTSKVVPSATMSPSAMKITLLASSATSSTSWVASRTALPNVDAKVIHFWPHSPGHALVHLKSILMDLKI